MIETFALLRRLSVLFSFSALLPHGASAQWAWSKSVSVSAETHWRGFAMDGAGAFYFAGSSDKLPQPDSRAFVVAKYGADTLKGWDARMYGPITAPARTEIGVDTAGNVYAISLFKGSLTRPDSTVMTSAADACLIAKYDSKGKHQWSKALGVEAWTGFKVHPDGTLGVHIPNFQAANGRQWGDTAFNLAAGNAFIEISGDGALRSVTALNGLATGSAIRWLESPAPGKLRAVIGQSSIYPNEPSYIKLADIDLASKTVEARTDSAKFLPKNSGGVSLEQFLYEEKTGHLFLLANAREGFLKVNDKDSLGPWLNNLSHVYHLLEFDGKMELVNRFMHTNPSFYSVRDSQIAIQALVHRNAGFLSDHGTVAAKGPTDEQITYVIGRDLRFKRKAVVQSPSSGNTNVTPRGLAIDADGDVYLAVDAGYTLNYPRASDVVSHPAALSTSAGICVLSKMADSASTGIVARRPSGSLRHARLRLFAAGRVRIERKGAFRFELADLAGASMRRGGGLDAAECDVSALAPGPYWVRVRSGNAQETLGIMLD